MGAFERKFKKRDMSVDWSKNRDLRAHVKKALVHLKLDPMAWAISQHAVLALVHRQHPDTLEAAKLEASRMVEFWTRNNKAAIQDLLLQGFDNREQVQVKAATKEGFARFLELSQEPGYLPTNATGAFGVVNLPTHAEMPGHVFIPNLPQEDARMNGRIGPPEPPDAGATLDALMDAGDTPTIIVSGK